MTGCKLKILDPTLKFYLDKSEFDSYQEFRETLSSKLNTGLIPIGNELKEIHQTIDGYSVYINDNFVEFDNLETLVNQVLAGLLETNNPDYQFNSFLQTFDIFQSKYNSPTIISTDDKEKDLDFIKSMVQFFTEYPVSNEFKNSDVYQDFLAKAEELRTLSQTIKSIEVEPEINVEESTADFTSELEPYVYTLTRFYDTPEGNVYTNTDPVAIIRHKVGKKIKELMESGQIFFMRMEPDNETNIQTDSVKNITNYGVVGVLYKLEGNDYKRVYVKYSDNNPNGNLEITTNESEAIALDVNKSKNLTFTLPDFSNASYLIRDNPVNPDVLSELIRLRELARSTPSLFYEVKQVRSKPVVAPTVLKSKRLITLKDFLSTNDNYKLEIATETDRVLYAGNLFVRFSNNQKAALNRTPLSKEWKQIVLDLLNHTFNPQDTENVVEHLNALLEYKGGDVQFFSRGNKIQVYRKSKKIGNKIIRLEKMEEVPTDEVSELLDYAKINVSKNYLESSSAMFPLIHEGVLKYAPIDFKDFYKDHHKTIARQVLVDNKLYFVGVNSIEFDIKSPSSIKLDEVATKLETPKIGNTLIEQDQDISLETIINDLPNLINETENETKQVLVLLNALFDNEVVKDKVKDIVVNFTTKYNKDFKGISTGKQIFINWNLLSNPNLMADVLAHELIHAFTKEFINNNPDNTSVKRLNELLKLVPETIPEYYRSNPYELLAVISNPDIAKELKKVKVEKSNLFDSLLDVFKKLIGDIFGVNYLEPTLYNELVTILVSVAIEQQVKPKEVKKSRFNFTPKDVDPLPLGYSQKDLDLFYEKNKIDKTFLNQLVNSIDGELAQSVHSNNLFQDFLAGRLDFTTEFRRLLNKLNNEASLKDEAGYEFSSNELRFFETILDDDNFSFIESYWIENTNFSKVRKPKKGEVQKVNLTESTEPTELEEEVIEEAEEKSEETLALDTLIDEGGNEDKLGVERGTDKSVLELADPMIRAFVKMLPRVERENGKTKTYSQEEVNSHSNFERIKFILVKPDTYIKFHTNELGRIELCDYTPTWNLIALNLSNSLSLEEMIQSVESNSKLIDIVPEIYIFKDRINVPITNEFKAEFKSKVESTFKKAKVGINVILQDKGNFLLIDESADFTSTAKRKVNTAFINSIQEGLKDFYDSERSVFYAKRYLRSRGLINETGEKIISKIESSNTFLEELGFILNQQTVFEGDFIRAEVQQFKSDLVGFLAMFDETDVKIADFITEDHGKIKGLNNRFKNVYKIENDIQPLVTTTMVKNAEGENQSVLSVYNHILQCREAYNKVDSVEELQSLIPRTKNTLFNYSLSKRVLFINGKRNDKKVLVDILSGLKTVQPGTATKGVLTINLEDADWLKLNFVGMLKAGMIENTRAETASTSYTFRMSDWGTDIWKQSTPFTISDIFKVWNVKDKSVNLDSTSSIYKVWSDYLKGELLRIKQNGLKLDKEGKPGEQFGLFADILSSENKKALLDQVFNSEIDDIIQNSTSLIVDSLNTFFTNQYKEYDNLFENVMGGYSSMIAPNKTDVEKDKGDVQIYNLIYQGANDRNNKDEYKLFFVLNALTIHTEETILFQGDLTESPKYFKRAKGVQSTGTPLSISEDLVKWVNSFLGEFSFASVLGSGTTVGKTFNSATIKDDVKKSFYHTQGLLQSGYVESKKEYNKETGKSQSEKDLKEEADLLLKSYSETNIGDGDGKITPDFYFALLMLVGNVSQEQILGFKALVLDSRKNASKYGLGTDQELTSEEEILMNEGLDLISKGKVVFPKLKVTYRGNALTDHVVSKEIMDKFALFPLFPQFTYDKPAAHDLLKGMIRENKAYVKFESGTKIQNLGVTDFLGKIEAGELNVSLVNSEHTLQTDNLREQIKTPNKTKDKNTFGSQYRKLIISGLKFKNKFVKLKEEETAGDSVRRWEKLNQELSELVKQEILSEFGISKQDGAWDFSNVDLPKVATVLLREAKRRQLPENIQVYFDKFKANKLSTEDQQDYYNLLELSFGNQQIQSLLASIIKKIGVQKLSGAQLIQVSQSLYDRSIKVNGKTRDLGFYHFKDGKVQAAECKVSLIGDFKNLLNLQEVKDKLKGIENPNILEQTRALNELLQDDSFVEKYKDQLTIIGYRIPTQGFNSMEVMVIREFLPTFYGPTIVCPPEITTQSGTDYDYDKLSMIFPSISKDGSMSNKGAKAVQNEMIKVSAQILLDTVNYHRLITPNTNAIIFDFLKGTKDIKGLLERLGISTKEPKNTEVITMLVNLAKFKAVKGKGLLGIAAVWNTFTTLIQRHNWIINNNYTKEIGFDTKTLELTVNVNPVLLKEKPLVIDASKLDTENGTSKQEIVSQLINVTVDMPSDDTFGQTVFNKSDFSALIYGISILGYDFETSMLFFHQPIIYRYKQLVLSKTQKGTKERVAKFEAMSELLGIPIPTNKWGTPQYIEFEQTLFIEAGIMENDLDISRLDTIVELKDIKDTKIDKQQKAVLSHYFKLLDQASQIRTIQSSVNFDTSPDNSLYKVEGRAKNKQEAIKANLVNMSYIEEIETDSVVSGLKTGEILSSIAQQVFSLLFTSENSKLFSEISDQYVGKEETAYRKAMNDFLLSIVQTYGEFNNENIVTFVQPFLNGKKNLDLYKKAKKTKEKINNQGLNFRLLNILLLNQSTKIKSFNPQILLGFENSPEDKEKITEEWRYLLNSSDSEIKEFAESLAVVGIVQSGWSKSPVYFSDLIPEEFITPLLNKAALQFLALSDEQKSEFRKLFESKFNYLEGDSLGRKDSKQKDGITYPKEGYRFMDFRIKLSELKQPEKVIVNQQKTYSGKVTSLKPNQVFVFGSNPLGINGNPSKGTGGAALVAHNIAGVKQGEKMDNKLSDSGKAWGITTVSAPGAKRSKTPDEIKSGIQKLYEYALQNPDKEFLIAYQGTESKNLNGYTNQELADMFSSFDIPNNVVFETDFSTLLSQQLPSDIFLDYVETLGKSTPKATDLFKYFGAMYEIQLDENGKGINVTGYEGKNVNKQKLLDAYNTNPNVDPQNGKPFRTVEQPVTEQKPLEEKGKTISVPEGSNPSNLPIFETEETVYLMNDQQQAGYDKIKSFVLERLKARDYEEGTQEFIEPLAKEYNNVIPKAMWNNMIGLIGKGGTGKAQPWYSKVYTPSGYKLMRDIQIGDDVISENGISIKVLDVFPQGIKDVYRITFDDGFYVDTCGEHNWLVKTYKQRQRETNLKIKFRKIEDCYEVMTTNQIKESIYYEKKKRKELNYKIPVNKPVLFTSNSNLVINPYLLGALIGDGGLTESIRLTNIDEFILNKISTIIDSEFDNLSLKQVSNTITYGITKKEKKGSKNKLWEEIKKLGLNVKSDLKFIPKEYIYTSIENRISLLQGLMDTDGFIDNRGTNCCYNTCSKQLAEDVAELAQSLGCICRITFKKNKFKGSYNVCIRQNDEFDLCSLPRKQERIVPKTKYKNSRYIKSVELIGQEEQKCILVDSPTHLYLTDNFTVTHNTTTIRKIINEIYNDLAKQNRYNTLTVTYVAPTHNAVTILQESLGEDSEKVSKRVKTSASLVLRNQKKGSEKAVAGKPEDDLLLLDNKYYKEQLEKGFAVPILESDIIVIDESSMIDKSFIDDLLYRFSIEEEFVGRKMPIFIYMGDYRQLPPIRSDMDKSFREGIISATLFSDTNKDKHAELTQVMRSKDQEFHRIFDSVGNQITNQREEFNDEQPLSNFDFKKYDEVTNKSSKNILIAKENQVDHIIDMYTDVLINNENPYKMFWVHYNKLSNERTQQIFKKIRERYFEKLGKPKPSDEIQSGDYIEFVDSLPLQTLNNGEHKIVNGEIKPRARLKVLEYGHTDNIRLESVSRTLSDYFGNLDLQGEFMIVYNRQNKKRYVQSIEDGSIGVGEYDKATKTQELFIIDNSGKKHIRKIPYGAYKNEIQPIINGLTRTINSLFKPSYIGSSHTVQGASIETVVVGDYNLRQNAPVINMRDMESSLYTMLTRAIKKLIIIKPNTIPIENNQEVFNLEDSKPLGYDQESLTEFKTCHNV